MRWLIYWLLFLFPALIFNMETIAGQDSIRLRNPSFEQNPSMGGHLSYNIINWTDCSKELFPMESPPDIHPGEKPIWGVTLQAKKGNTYLGLVTRYNNTFESISQKLKQPLLAGKCYSFQLFLALSKKHDSPTSRSIENVENFANPVELVIWGGEDACHTGQCLAKSGAVANNEWIEYRFKLVPEKDFSFITLEAFYLAGSHEPYNGHILIDGLSPIVEIDCE